MDPLSLRELQNLEEQIDTSLKRVRSRKNQLIHDFISQLHKKEKALQEQNKMLVKKLEDKEKPLTEQTQMEQQNLGQNSLSLMPPPPPLLALPSLTIGGTLQARVAMQDGAETQRQPNISTNMPPWMLQHVQERFKQASAAQNNC